MEALTRQEYPAMLERLQPAAAVSKFNERVKKLGKTNSEIADWLQERRKIEEAYVAGLKKLVRRPLQDVGTELGVFEVPWRKIVASTEEIASSHHALAQRIEKDVEQPLRNFSSMNREMQQMSTVQGNLGAMAKELDAAQERSNKLAQKGGKASAAKVDQAAVKLQVAEQQWNSQAPFIFETLQALDERRLNHLRDVLTQYETHQADQIERCRVTVEETLTTLLEVETDQEIRNWSEATVAGRPITERRARQLSEAEGGNAANVPPPTPPARSIHTSHGDNQSQHSSKPEKENLKSRFGTMMSRRRQSIHGGLPSFGRAPSPSKGGFVSFGRGNSGSRDGQPTPSPRASSSNLQDPPLREHRLTSLPESPPNVSPTTATNGTNGVTPETSHISDSLPARPQTSGANGGTMGSLTNFSEYRATTSGSRSQGQDAKTDAEGFSVPPSQLDAISQAQQEAAQELEQPQFKLDIRNEPIPEQDADAQAALSNVANTLRSSQMATPNRKVGTVRGRRDVRSTIFVPSPNTVPSNPEPAQPPMPNSPSFLSGRNAALAALSSSDQRNASVSDTTSIRSGHSLTSHAPIRHAEMHNVGLNASVIEHMSASFENGIVKTSRIAGEIAFTYIKNTDDDAPLTPETEVIKVNNFPNLEAIGMNHTFVHPVSAEKPDEFKINLASVTSRSSVGLSYRVHTDDSNIPGHGPLFIKPAWKQLSDKLQLLVEYGANPALGTQPISFKNLMIVATYEGAKAASCQTKPNGIHIRDKYYVYWRLGDVTLGHTSHKVICRLTGVDGSVPTPGRIEARWEISGPEANGLALGSGISLSKFEVSKGKEKEEVGSDNDPFADESLGMPKLPSSPAGGWVGLETSRKFVSEKYVAIEEV
ncbi:hypothetical protein HYALB_00011598 [Hymenoscyphus albidus]|uniref:MHD domain-containing protein n=1 Tax=Hymenoscyphus albidus TaxID=595503 RepID=A0A9N9LV66_9HELO|nr:hypothetical protein HYALB_00011598 [Hymenoscyphus albidus]